MTRSPRCCASFHKARNCAFVGATGFSTITCAPAWSAAVAQATWVGAGVSTCTTSGRTSWSIVAASVNERGRWPATAANRSAAYAASDGERSQMPVRSAVGQRERNPRCSWEIRPAPITATRSAARLSFGFVIAGVAISTPPSGGGLYEGRCDAARFGSAPSTMRAGMPNAVAPGGTSSSTTDNAPTFAPSPTVMPPSTCA